MKTSEVLDLAADHIQARGWAQGKTGEMYSNPWGTNDPTSPVCLEGALVAAMGYELESVKYSSNAVTYVPPTDVDFDFCPAYAAMAEYLGVDSHLYEWNDTQERTAEEVISALRAAAAVQRAKEEEEEALVNADV